MAKGKRNKYKKREDLDSEYLAGVVDEVLVEHREVLDFAERVAHDPSDLHPKGAVMMRYAKVPKNKSASIVGFAAKAQRIGKGSYSEALIEPFHIKNSAMTKVGERGYRLDGDEPSLDSAVVLEDTAELERLRQNLVVEGFCALFNTGKFEYMDGENEDESNYVISVDFTSWIPTIPAAGTGTGALSGTDYSDQAAVKPLMESRRTKAAYRSAEGINFPPNLAFINPNTAAVMQNCDDIMKKYRPLSSSDPDNTEETYDGFNFDGIDYIVWHKQYTTPDGPEWAVPDGYAIYTVRRDPKTGTAPLMWHSAANVLNNQDGSQARYTGITEGQDEPEIGVKLYDNGIPAPARKNLVQKQQLY